MDGGCASVLESAAAVRSGSRSALSIAEECLDRADAYDAVQPQVWISRLSRDDVLARAREVDGRMRAGEALPLAGVPFAIKDNIDVAGVETTAGCPAFRYAAVENATAVARLIGAGAVPIGKTNLDQFATGLTGTRSPYGAVGCVFNRDYIAGGSSSGSAVAVTVGLVPFAVGTDTAGSGRVPAAFNGLFGFKPTRGRWSTRGVVPACRSLDCVTVFTNSVADAAALDSVLTAFDDADPWSRCLPDAESKPVRVIGVPRAGQLEWFGDAQSAALFARAVDRASRIASVIEVDIAPLLECARLLYQGPWIAERALPFRDLLRKQPDAIHPVTRVILQAGLNIPAVDAFEGFHALKRYERAAEMLWSTVDALLLPTAPAIYRTAEVLAEPFALNTRLGTYTNFVNLLDMAAISIPAGFRDNRTGFGVSVIGPAWSDVQLMDFAERFATLTEISAPPLDLDAPPLAVKLAVVGAHLAGLPLHWQLASRGARLVRIARTQATYRLYAMAGSSPPKPALAYAEDGAAIEVEIYELGEREFGSFVAEVPPPLTIGTIALEDGASVKGFLGEPRALQGAEDITRFGGWRNFLAARSG
jgi:allophanate hydrolase